MKKLVYTILSAATALSLLSSSCSSKTGEWNKKMGMIWNTSFHMTFNGPAEYGDSAISVLNRLGASLSVFDTTSLVSEVNRRDSTPVNTDFIRIYVKSRQVNKLSGGDFDPTVSPLITAWGFGKGHRATPDTVAIDSILKFVGIRKTRLSHDALIKDDPRIQFNFSAIAKGYGCDAVAEMFETNGIDRYLIEIGGEIRTNGKNPDGNDWKISIDRPILSSDKEIHLSQEIIAVSDIGIATSGNYRNYHSDEYGEIYGHVISPVTGRPVSTDLLSATVLSRTAMEADALATAFMAIGSERAIKLGNSLRLPFMLILKDSTIRTSPQFDRLIHKN